MHADKPEMNERMMRELGRVHATMVAANKQAASGSSGRTRGSQDSTAAGGSATSGGGRNPGRSKARPGTSTGYEGAGGGEGQFNSTGDFLSTNPGPRHVPRPIDGP